MGLAISACYSQDSWGPPTARCPQQRGWEKEGWGWVQTAPCLALQGLLPRGTHRTEQGRGGGREGWVTMGQIEKALRSKHGVQCDSTRGAGSALPKPPKPPWGPAAPEATSGLVRLSMEASGEGLRTFQWMLH